LHSACNQKALVRLRIDRKAFREPQPRRPGNRATPVDVPRFFACDTSRGAAANTRFGRRRPCAQQHLQQVPRNAAPLRSGQAKPSGRSNYTSTNCSTRTAATGRSQKNSVNPLISLFTPMRPSCACTIWRAMDRPKPTPSRILCFSDR
jgi:hypothetical protein